MYNNFQYLEKEKTLVIPDSSTGKQVYLHLFRGYHLQASGTVEGRISRHTDDRTVWTTLKSTLQMTGYVKKYLGEVEKNFIINLVVAQILDVISYCDRDSYELILEYVLEGVDCDELKGIVELAVSICNSCGAPVETNDFKNVIMPNKYDGSSVPDELAKNFNPLIDHRHTLVTSSCYFDRDTKIIGMTGSMDNCVSVAYSPIDLMCSYSPMNQYSMVYLGEERPKLTEDGAVSLDECGNLVTETVDSVCCVSDDSMLNLARLICSYEFELPLEDVCTDKDVEVPVLAVLNFLTTWCRLELGVINEFPNNYDNSVYNERTEEEDNKRRKRRGGAR